MPLYPFRCPRDHDFEEIREQERRDVPRMCECGLLAKRQATAAVQLNPPTGAGLRSKFGLFQEATQEIDHAYTKVETDLERPIQSPNLWLQAKSRVQAMTAAGEAPLLANPMKE